MDYVRFRVHQDPIDFHVIEECAGFSMEGETNPKGLSMFKPGFLAAKLSIGKSTVYIDPINALRLAAFLTQQASLTLQKQPDIVRRMF